MKIMNNRLCPRFWGLRERYKISGNIPSKISLDQGLIMRMQVTARRSIGSL